MWDTLIFWAPVAFLVFMPVLWAYRDAPDFPSSPSVLWHSIGWVLRALPAVFIIQDGWLTVAYCFYFRIVFELTINKLTNKDLFYMDKSTLTGELLNSFYVSGVVIFWAELGLMFLAIGIKYKVFEHLFNIIKNYITQLI